MTRRLVPLLLLLGLLLAVLVGVASRANADAPGMPTECNPATEVIRAQVALGDHTAPVRWIDRATADKSGLSEYAGWSDSTGVTLITDLPCEYVAFVASHELAHQAEFRKYGSVAAARVGYGNAELERVAQCMAETTGFKGYRAYGVGSLADCSDYEQRAARELYSWTS